MKRLAVAAAFLAIAAPALAAHPATIDEARPFYAAAAHLHAVGVTVAVPQILVMDTETDDAGDCGTQPIIPWACTWPDRIVLSWEAAGQNRITSRMLAQTTRRGRQRIMAACYTACIEALVNDTHELVHAARFQAYAPITPDRIGPIDFEEGLADSVSMDQACPLERRITGALQRSDGVPWCKLQPAYPSMTQRARWISAIESGAAWTRPQARRWRLQQVSTPMSWGVSAIIPGVVS